MPSRPLEHDTPREIAVIGYPVIVGRGVLESAGDIIREHASAHRFAIVTDTNVGPRYADRVRSSLGDARASVYTIPAGETYKTREQWASVTDAMLADGYGRDTTVIALGGGVVGDLAGFVAATYMRGVPFVQVPTTLLAMIDASVGGKTGVDTPAGKNLVGAFHQPAAVIADPETFATLPREELRSGLAEAVKHAVIADEAYLEEVMTAGAALLDSPSDPRATSLVARSVEIKADVVRRDEREGGVRKTLNFGHTIGHAIEHESGYALLHGEAVAIGMVLESRVAERVRVAEHGTAETTRNAIVRLGLPERPPRGVRADALLAATRLDKKARAGRVEYSLPARVGAMAAADRGWGVAVPDDVVLEVLREAGADA